ncbi:MAG TPA: hypothetical protein VMZ90_03215 [Vicinamibacterales bacterium]|nr:hypothetical protein [Vicinamibacterales bacterium]
MTRSTRQVLGATLLYTVATCAMTWPLVGVMHRDIASDMGDPVLNCWILLWTSGQVLAFLSGDFGALARYWQGNIFYPETLTIAYSEHLTTQMLQALPVLAASNNVILTYNLLFLLTFVLSGLGMFLLVRDLTGRALPALVAGLAFAFAPYRFDQLSHLQVLSAQWMPFALYGFRRYLESGRRRALAGGAAALVAQNLSCGYYALFFPPFAAAYVIYELAARRRLGDGRAWRAFALTGLVVALLTLPFLTPYLEVRGSGVGVRSPGEIAMFSADVHAFATAPSKSWLWGDRLATFHRAEGQAFPGLAVLVLALAGIVGGFLRRTKRDRPALSAWRQFAVGMLTMLLAGYLYAFVSVLLTGRFTVSSGGVWMVWVHADRVIAGTIVLALALAFVLLWKRPSQPRNRETHPGLPWAFYALATVVAAVLAMGPHITVRGAVVAPGPYAWLMDYVPGFDGLRVPARYVMLVTLFLAVLAGLGASELLARARRVGAALIILAGVFIVVESWPREFEMNSRIGVEEHLVLTPQQLQVGKSLPPIYKTIRDLDPGVVLIEFPFRSTAWDLHAVFYAGYHRQHLINGYSGFFPQSNAELGEMLNRFLGDPQAAWRALLGSGATHALVHEAAFPEPSQKVVTDWLVGSGAREILVDGTDRLFTVR